MSRLGSSKTAVSSLPFTLTPTVQTCVNDNNTHKSISSSCLFVNEPSLSRNKRSASKTNVVESCLQDVAAQLGVEFGGLVSSKKLVQDQLMVNRESGQQKLSYQQEQRSIPERAFQNRDTQRLSERRNQQVPPLQDTGSPLVVCSMTQRGRLNPKGKSHDEPMFICTSITIGRWNEYSGAENFEKERKLVGQPGQNERRMSSSMQQKGMCGVSATWHEQLDKLFVLKIVLPNSETWDKSMFIHGTKWFSGVTAGRMMFPLQLQEGDHNNPGYTKAINQQYSRKSQSVVEAVVVPEVQHEIVRLWFNKNVDRNQVGVPMTAVSHSTAKIGDGELGRSGSYRSRTLLGQFPRQKKIQWFQIDPGGKSSSDAGSSSTRAMQLVGQLSVTSAASTRGGNSGPERWTTLTVGEMLPLKLPMCLRTRRS
ncbi:uncharacterized protein LOC119765584 isoform X1 [Culex quinquefasciatus]|uniref:uncharacterized protein LOC119765584 isoform X1 n=1 Tax=Culex quinquefasciatus TaxID=7176 RepID=UPI0018E3E2BA|nr:uncharacterized protein LOC119765584 isoform X1 [Culex quinquefasciatus]XP_038105709.1 uncharacterized protein LOC119765584 isoform X1 [Culex quinquefasciatus]XP_038105710.1 uncharacterized protein LOC119765584 isoform X1 [Culex quinquefasciatus]